MSVFTGGPYGRLAIMLNTLSSLNKEIISVIIIIIIITLDFNLTYRKMGEIWGRNQNDKSEKFRYFSIKSYVVDMY